MRAGASVVFFKPYLPTTVVLASEFHGKQTFVRRMQACVASLRPSAGNSHVWNPYLWEKMLCRCGMVQVWKNFMVQVLETKCLWNVRNFFVFLAQKCQSLWKYTRQQESTYGELSDEAITRLCKPKNHFSHLHALISHETDAVCCKIYTQSHNEIQSKKYYVKAAFALKYLFLQFSQLKTSEWEAKRTIFSSFKSDVSIKYKTHYFLGQLVWHLHACKLIFHWI